MQVSERDVRKLAGASQFCTRNGVRSGPNFFYELVLRKGYVPLSSSMPLLENFPLHVNVRLEDKAILFLCVSFGLKRDGG